MNTDFSNRKLVAKYSKKYAYAPYLNEDIGWEMESLPGDDPLEAQAYLKSLSDQTHKTNNPHLYENQYVKTPPDFEEKTGIPYIYTNSPQMFETQPITEPKISPQDEENNLITSIESAKNEQELIQYKLLAAKNSRTTGAYNRRKKQLNITN